MRILRALSRRISWLTAAVSFQKPIIGTLATGVGAVPVSRAMDNAKAANGIVCLPDPHESPKILYGEGTNFEGPGFEAGGSIYLPTINGESHKLDIAEIYGPTELLLKRAPTHPDALQQLSGPGGSKFKVAPHIDQTEVYKSVFDRLREDGCVGIFPEGGSHDRSDLLPLKGQCSCLY